VDTNKNNSKQGWLLFLLILTGLVARMQLATFGTNYDMASYRIVVDILNHGGSVYAGTERYNYGPVWFQILHGLDFLAGHNESVFRYLVAGFLSLVDIGICLFLWRRFGYLAACVFFLNPVSIIITGFHCQFDNLAILMGLLAVWMLGDELDQPVNRRKLLALVILGLSLATKHILFAFPFWLAVKQKGVWQKVIVVLVPVLVFLAGFAPYWHEGRQGIIEHVFQYRSFSNDYFYNFFIPGWLHEFYSSRTIWFFCIAIFAFIYRKKSTIEFLLAYTCVLVATSPAIVNQYLAIPLAFVATRLNPLTALYTILGTWVLIIHRDGLHMFGVLPRMNLNTPIHVLFYALVWITWQKEITAVFRSVCNWCIAEVKNQLGIKP
jgi:hypothetical protein